ncbi:MAG TPA: serine/threonine-protein kinase [Myxococcota bacterium]|nr:serine/threonine-protein kinase [Myxococcota bacterium]HRY96452.1 serine/threonine-protein kinase [Myxococcota bacterium]
MTLKHMNNCEIVGEIGTGGMAVVYKAVQKSLNRPVAVKVLRSEYVNDPQIVARFVREATSVAALQHENIVHIHDFVKEDGTYRMVMEYVEGIDLFDLLEKVHHLPPNVGAILGLGLCSALEYAHYRGIIHRDIKPSNVILSRKGEVKLMDFGIARDENLGDLTRPGTSLGTPAYMSPEQIMGVKIDARSDIFSFGIVLYQLLTGQKPFVEGAGKSIMHKILNTEFIRPRRINPNIPRRLERLVLRCLAKEPVDRFQSTGELKRALESYLTPRVRIHYSARLVAFLAHRGVVGVEEAQRFVMRGVLEDAELVREDEGLPPPLRARTVAKVQAGLGAAVILWVLLVHLVAALSSAGVEAAPAGPPGALKVVAWPWAEIFIDGAYVDTTPVDRAFGLSAGVHELTLKNPAFRTETRKVLIEPGRTQKLVLELTRAKGRAR